MLVNSSGVRVVLFVCPPDESGGYAQVTPPEFKIIEGLREVHRLNDFALEHCYRSRPFECDEGRLEYLFKLYKQMIEKEKREREAVCGRKEKEKIKPLGDGN